MFAVAGASGQLGRLAIADLLARVPADQIAALVRDPGKVAGMAALGIAVREADYDRPETLEPALAGIERLLLISGSEVGQRQRQHQAVIDAAVAAGVRFICYTSVLHADRSTIGLAEEHRQTEAAIRASGLHFALLRNGWYSENYTGALAPSIEFGVIAGSSGEGRISAAPRKDYATAAAAVLAAGDANAVHELAGDAAFTMAEFAAEVSRQAGKTVVYQDMPEAAYAGMLESVGLPAPIAAMIADSSFRASKDMLFDDSGTLSRLIGRPTTPIAASIAEALETVGAGSV
jgi:NAD(P)H dehydrogenase (quinone)